MQEPNGTTPIPKEPTPVPFASHRPTDNVVHQYKDGALVTIHEGFREAAREIGGSEASEYSIKYGCKKNLFVYGYRWLAVDRSLPRVAMPLPPASTTRRKGMVAQLALDRSRIIAVFGNLKLAGEAVGLANSSSLTTSMNGGPTGPTAAGCRWEMYEDCSDALREAFGPVVLMKEAPVKGKKILQIHPYTNEVVRVFKTITEACTLFQGSHKLFHEACNEGTKYKEFNWRLV